MATSSYFALPELFSLRRPLRAEAAVDDARTNARINGIDNVQFVCGNLSSAATLLDAAATSGPSSSNVSSGSIGTARPGAVAVADVVVADPARAGLSDAVIAFLENCGAARVVYVSCNAATQARDLGFLCGTLARGSGGAGRDGVAQRQPAFRLVSVTPIDMFPHTDHVETVAILERVP